MGTTTNGLPYPEGTDPVANGDDTIKALAQALDPWAKDTNWTAMTLAAGVTGTLKYRQLGKVVHVFINVAATTVSGTNLRLDNASAGGLPAAMRPSITVFTGGYFAGFPGSVFVGNSGDVTAVQNSGANRASVAGILSYPIGI